MNTYDLVIVGAGPGGYVAAIYASHLGLKTALVEKDTKLGGTCLLRGCIPTKSLLHSADLLTHLKHSQDFGIRAENVGFDFAGVQKAREKIVAKSAAGVAYLMKQNKIEVHQGLATLVDNSTLEVNADNTTTKLSAKNIILATGSVPKKLPSLNADSPRVITSDEILTLKQPPKSLIVMGAGAVGIEFASIFARFGTQCTLVEMLPHVLPAADTEVSLELEKQLKKRAINIYCDTRVTAVNPTERDLTLSAQNVDGPLELQGELLLVAVGRAPYTQGLGLENVGLKTNPQGFLEVNGHMQTKTPNIYAIGDIVPSPQLAHVASAEALVAVDHLAGKKSTPVDYLTTPLCTYSDPEVASCGHTEKSAQEKGHEIKIGKFPFAALGKARVLGQTDGFVKIIADKNDDQILGVHIIGAHATELIAEAVLAMRMETTSESLAKTMHAHPTLAEAVMEAAHAAWHKPIHL